MKRMPSHDASWLPGEWIRICANARQAVARNRGFTLLEMCMVLFMIALLFGLSVPAIDSAFTEQAVRKDAHQLALMVKTAVIQSTEQNRPYVIDLSGTSMALHPQGAAAAEPGDDPDANDQGAGSTLADATDSAVNNPTPVNVSLTTTLDPPNQLQMPDPKKVNAWIAMADNTEWVFQPGDLCQAPVVRITRGDAWIQMTFNALTGNVESESNSIP